MHRRNLWCKLCNVSFTIVDLGATRDDTERRLPSATSGSSIDSAFSTRFLLVMHPFDRRDRTLYVRVAPTDQLSYAALLPILMTFGPNSFANPLTG